MPQFSYRARRRSGETVTGVLDVADRSAALVQIERLGLFPVAVDMPKGAAAKSEKPAGSKASFADMLPPSMREAMTRKRKPKLQELATFTQQLANLLQAGMPLTVALNSMTHLETKGIPKEVSGDLRQEVMEGRSLSDSMAKQPLIFSELYINMVKAGEQSGALVDVLRRMANHFERYAEVQSKLKSALIYPVMVCLVGIGLMLFFIYFMLPQFEKMFSGFNVELPMPTKFLIGVGKVFTNVWWMTLFMMVLVAVSILIYRFRRSTEGRERIDRLMLRLPIIGKVICLNYYGQFARTLSTLLENGVPVLTALKITEQVMANGVIKNAISKTREAVTDGKTLAQPLAASKVFPQLMVDLVKIGEETGDVPAALKNVADTYDSELTIALRVMMTLIEPLLIIIMALGVGFLLLSVLLPMFRLISNISGGMGNQ